MGFLFSRPAPSPSHRSPPTRGQGQQSRAGRHGQQRQPSQQPTENDVASYIEELLELSSFFDELDNLTAGDTIPYKIAGEALDLDDDAMNSYLAALTMKADNLSGIRKFLNRNPQVVRADLLRQLLDDVEPKCRQMREKLSRLRASLVVADTVKQSTVAQAPSGSDDQPGPSGLCGSTQASASSGSNQPSPTRSSRVLQQTPTSAAAGAPDLWDSQRTVSSVGSGDFGSQSDEISESEEEKHTDEESQSEEEDDVSRGMSGGAAKLSQWRDKTSIPNAKHIKIVRSKNLLDQVVPWYSTVKPRTLKRILAVTFDGEQGMDFGALTREFFFITFEAVISGSFKGCSRFLEGERGHLIPNAMTDCRAFTCLGRMIVHAVINGCKGLPGLSPAIIHYLVSGKTFMQLEDSHPPLHVDDVADPQLKQLLQKYENGDAFNEPEEDAWMNWMTESNCQANWRSSLTRQFVIQQILLHYVFMKRIRQIQALEEGLKELGFLPFLVKNSAAEDVSEVFPSDTSTTYSPETVEAVIITRGDSFDLVTFEFFKQFLRDLHAGAIADYRLCDLIQFVTSSPYLPERLVVSFRPDITIPEAHACYNEISLPLAHQSYPDFKEALVTAFQNGLSGFQLQ